MAYLAVVGSKAVNGVAAIHSDIIKRTIFKVCMSPPCIAGMSCHVQPCSNCTQTPQAEQQALHGTCRSTLHMSQETPSATSFLVSAKQHLLREGPAGAAHLQDFYELAPHKFQNKTNGVTPRRWLAWCNPGLAALITETLGTDTWPNDLNLLTGRRKHADDKEFQKKWRAIKHENKAKLAAKIKVRHPTAGPMRAIYVTANCDNCHVHSLPESCSSP